MKIQLSVTIITFNEEEKIRRCIESVLPVADEVVVVDSLSTDRTGDICQDFGVRFIRHPFEGYIEQKNFAVKQATYPYVLSLDADEALTPRLCELINEVRQNWNADGYYVNRLNNYCGKWIRHCGWYPDKKLRLWDSRKGEWGGVNPHDRVVMRAGSTISRLNSDLLHYTYERIEQHIHQMNRFTEISAREKFKQNIKIGLSFTLLRVMAAFVKQFFLKLGLLDGYYGFVICSLSAFEVFLKDTKLRQLNKNRDISGTSKRGF